MTYAKHLISLLFGLAAFASMAQADNRRLVHHGRILRPDGSALYGNFQMEAKIYSPDPSRCLLWSESKQVSFGNGAFSMDIGDSFYRPAGAAGGKSTSFNSVFINNAAYNLTGGDCGQGSTYNPQSTDSRRMVITLYDGPRIVKVYDDLIRSVPFAIESHNSNMVGGYGSGYIFKFNETGAHKPSLTFSTIGASLLWDLAETTTPNFGGKRLKGLLEPVDPSDAATLKTVTDKIASITGGSMGGGVTRVDALSNSTDVLAITGAPITGAGTLQFSFTPQSQGTFFAAPNGGGTPSFRAIDVADIPNLDASKITSGTLPVSRGGTGLGNYTPYALMTANGTGSAIEQRTCLQGETLEWQVGTGFNCVPRLSGSGTVTEVTAGNGLLGGSITSSGTLSVDVGLTDGKIVAVGTGNKIPSTLIPSLDLSTMTGTLGVNRGGTGLVPSAGNANQLYGINAAGNAAEFKTLVAGTGLTITHTAGSISLSVGSIGVGQWSDNTLGIHYSGGSVGIGTASPSAKLEVSSGIANTSGLKFTNFSSSSPTSIGQAVGVDASGNLVTISAGAGGTVTNVGFTAANIFNIAGAPITGTGTIDLTLASQAPGLILASPAGASGVPTFRSLAGTDLPVIAGTGVTLNLSSGSLQISAAGSGGTVTAITAGTGLLGGTITGSGTVAIDVGLTDGKIVAVGIGDKIPSALIPALDLSTMTGTLGVSHGGTGLVPSAGNANQLYGINAAGNAAEFKTLVAGTGLTITHTAGSISLSVGSTSVGQWSDNAQGIHYSSGSVGIGTNTPARLLHVNGPMHITPAALPSPPAAGDLAFDSATSNALKFYDGTAWQTVGTSSGGGDFMKDGSVAMTGQLKAVTGTAAAPSYSFSGDTTTGVYRPSTNNLGFSTNSTERMRIDALGNVGIGTSSPGYPLTVRSDDAKGIAFENSSSGNKQWRIAGEGNDFSVLESGVGYALTLKSGGKAGLGTFYPAANLEVRSTDDTSLKLVKTGSLGITTTVKSNQIEFEVEGGGTEPIIWKLNYLERIRFAANGNVGIGTTNPGTKLEVNGTSGTTLKIVDGNQGVGKVLTSDASGVASWATPSAGGGLTNFTESVNTSAPNATVPVVQLLATNAATNVDVALGPKGSGALTAQIADGAMSGGNKRGIYAVDWQRQRGVASEVASGNYSAISGGSSNTASGYYSLANNMSTTAASYAQSTFGAYNLPKGSESATSWVSTDPLFVVGNGTGSGASRSNALMILKNGNVGIGTTSPYYPLQVGDGTSGGIAAEFRTNFAGIAPALSVYNGSSNQGRGPSIAFQNNSTQMGQIAMTSGINDSYSSLIFMTKAGEGIESEKMRIDMSGNVGIGTTNPGAKLEVSSGIANTSGLKFTNFNSSSPTSTGQAVGVDASGNLVTIAADGAVSITAGTGLSGDTIVSTGTISIAPGGVGTIQLADASITTPKLFANPGAGYLVATDASTGSTLRSLGCANGQVLLWGATGWDCADQTSLGVYTSKSANTVLAAPNGSSGVPSFRTLVANDIPSLDGNKITTGTVTAARLGSGSSITTKFLRGDNTWQTVSASPGGSSTQVQFNNSGSFSGSNNLVWDNSNSRLGVGTTSPAAAVDVANGQAVARDRLVSSGASADFSTGNTQVLASVGTSTITLSNMIGGGNYTVVITDTVSRTYSFGGCVTTYWQTPSAPTSDRSVFSILAVTNGGGVNCFISWATGYN